jgi:hypothetical protein
MALRLRRGLEALRSTITPAEGEIIYTTDSKRLYVGDGLTAGGNGVSAPVTSVNNRVGAVQLTSDDLSEGTTNQFYSDDRSQDATWALLNHGLHSNVSFTYDDANNRIVASASASFTAENAIDTIANVLVNSPHTGITFSHNDNADQITATVTAASETFKTIMVSPRLSLTVTGAGSSYTSIPLVSVSAPPVGGTQATAEALLAPTFIANFKVLTQGTNYSEGTTVTASGPGVERANGSIILGPSGNITKVVAGIPGNGFIDVPTVVLLKPTAATATYVSGGQTTTIVVSNIINTIFVGMTVTGTGFSSGQKVTAVSGTTITLSAGASSLPAGTLTFTDTGDGASFEAVLAGTTIEDVVVLNGGSGYTSNPIITIAPPVTYSFNAATDVDTVANSITILDHPYQTGSSIIYTAVGGSAIGGLTSGTTYFVVKINGDTFKLASNITNALISSSIDLTSTSTGTHTFRGVQATASSISSSDIMADSSTDTLNFAAGGDIIITTNLNTDTITISNKNNGKVLFGAAGQLAFYPDTSNKVDSVGSTLTFRPPNSDGAANGALVVNGQIEFENLVPKIYSANANLTIVAKQAGGFVEVGDREYDGRFGVISNGYIANNGAQFKVQQAHNTTDANNTSFIRSRGTIDVPTACLPGDKSGDIIFQAHDGLNYLTHAAISAVVDGAYSSSSNKMPGRLDFYTRSATDTLANLVLRLKGDKNSEFSGTVTATSFIGSGASLTNLPVNSIVAGGGISVVNNSGAITITATGSDIPDVVVTTSSYANPTWITSLSETKVLPSQSGNNGKYLTTNGSVTSWSDFPAGGGLVARAGLSGTTASIANNATDNVNITGYKGYALLKIQTSAAAWVRVYVSDAARTSDAARAEGVDPLPDAGVIAEIITTGAQTVLIAPGAFGFNNESPVTNIIPVAVTNKSGSTGTITVTLTAVQLEV